jgi:hypothetical protein
MLEEQMRRMETAEMRFFRAVTVTNGSRIINVMKVSENSLTVNNGNKKPEILTFCEVQLQKRLLKWIQKQQRVAHMSPVKRNPVAPLRN